MLYKYLPPERIDILQNMQIRFSQLGALNDPFESTPLLEFTDAKESFRRAMEARIGEAVKYAKSNAEADIGEVSIRAEVNRRQFEVDFEPQALGRATVNKLDELNGIISLSRNFTNLLMWAHYTDSHKGMVVGFDEDNEFFHPKGVDNSKDTLLNVVYTSRRSVTRVSDNQDGDARWLCEKPIDWAYEEEVRVLMGVENDNNQSKSIVNGYPVWLADIPKNAIKEIYIGANAEGKFISGVLNAVIDNNLEVDLYSTEMCKKSYSLNCELYGKKSS